MIRYLLIFIFLVIFLIKNISIFITQNFFYPQCAFLFHTLLTYFLNNYMRHYNNPIFFFEKKEIFNIEKAKN